MKQLQLKHFSIIDCHSPRLLRIHICQSGQRLTTEYRKESITMEKNNRRDAQEDPTPLTDEEFDRFQKKEKRKITIIGDIIEFIVNFFR